MGKPTRSRSDDVVVHVDFVRPDAPVPLVAGDDLVSRVADALVAVDWPDGETFTPADDAHYRGLAAVAIDAVHRVEGRS